MKAEISFPKRLDKKDIVLVRMRKEMAEES